MSDLITEMINDEEARDPDRLTLLSELAQKMRDVEADIVDLEEQLKKKNDSLAEVRDHMIPDLLDELGLSEITLKDGSRIFISTGYATSISKEHEAAAYKWLRDNGHGSIIKHILAVNLKKGDQEIQKKLVDVFHKEGVNYEDKESIHASTLKAFVKEQMSKEGSTLPQDVFGVFPIRQAKIK